MKQSEIMDLPSTKRPPYPIRLCINVLNLLISSSTHQRMPKQHAFWWLLNQLQEPISGLRRLATWWLMIRRGQLPAWVALARLWCPARPRISSSLRTSITTSIKSINSMHRTLTNWSRPALIFARWLMVHRTSTYPNQSLHWKATLQWKSFRSKL